LAGKFEFGKSPEELYQEREKRYLDAIRLRIPDRVPVVAGMGYFPAKYTGISCEAAWYDYDGWLAAYKKTLQDFQPDMLNIQPFTPGIVNEIMGPKNMRWPGHGVSAYHSHQSVEHEFMKADEYDHFLNNTADYLFRVHMSRTTEAAAGWGTLPELTQLGMAGAGALADYLTRPEVAGAIETLQKAGREMAVWRSKMMNFSREIEKLGFPPPSRGFAMTPFDIISNLYRGMKGAIMDMFRQPDKLLAACEKILALTLERPLFPPAGTGNNRVFIPLTRGSDDFMSLKQFETFYWPTLKKLVQALLDRGAMPCIFFEGNFITRLEYFLDFPKGTLLAQLDKSDIFKAKEILKGHTCIKGNVPSSILQMGTVQEVKDYCKKLIDGVGKDGGFILSPRGSTDEVKPENLQALIEFTKEYGVYR
jgi:hypothetical protein